MMALGIGAIIGSGIFVLTGTAAAGEHFEAPSILHAQVLDLLVNFVRTGSTAGALMHGRPPAGPSIAISFILVAIACSFAGLCYAELASMIPIAGSAYTAMSRLRSVLADTQPHNWLLLEFICPRIGQARCGRPRDGRAHTSMFPAF